jgi:hypothetical protein
MAPEDGSIRPPTYAVDEDSLRAVPRASFLIPHTRATLKPRAFDGTELRSLYFFPRKRATLMRDRHTGRLHHLPLYDATIARTPLALKGDPRSLS